MKKITFLSICILMVTNLFATDYYVKVGGSPTADGLSEATAFNTVNVAVSNAAVLDGDRIFIVGAITQTGVVSITKSLSFQGISNAVITGGTSFRMYNLLTAGKTISFSDITFKDVVAPASPVTGGAVASLTVASNLSFTNCTFSNNTATANGGALAVTAGNLTITNCTFSGNSTTAGNGGAIFADGAGVLSVTTSTFLGNSSSKLDTTANGGAISVGPNVSRQSLISYSTFYNNTTDLQGGALAFFGTNATSELKNITCFENKIRATTANADRGAGIRIEGTRAFAIKNTLVFGNTSKTAGTAIASGIGAIAAVTLTLTNSLSNSTVPTPVSPDDVTGSNISANLTSSNLAYDPSSGFVKYTDPTTGDATPISFGSDGNDAGAWNSPNTWTGTSGTSWIDATNWSIKGVPDATKDALIAAAAPVNQPIIGSNASVKSLTLNASTSLTVSSGFNLTVAGAIANSGAMTIESNANLIQGGTTNANTGNVIVKRSSNALFRSDYTIWSSPVTNASSYLKAFSPLTVDTRFYNYNETTNKYNAVEGPSTTPFALAAGYLIRMPNNGSTAYEAGTETLTYPGEFTGVPNNGTITKAVTYNGSAPFGYNMVGNPYPSTINADAFITANAANIETGLYFWRKKNAVSGSAYAIYNPLGGTTVAATAPTSEVPSGIIQVGQGFFVKAKSASNLTFTNAMRVSNNDNQFFKTKAVQKDRLWLNLTTASGVFSQTLVGYTAEASQGLDIFDAKYFNDSPIALTSNINNEEYTIQGRPAFDPSDIVALNFKTDAAGDYTISLDHFDGVFAAGQDIFLKDNTTGAETNLKNGSYTFNAASGTDNTRFSLTFQKTLKVGVPAFNENSVSVYNNNGTLYVNSGLVAMSNISVFDVQGRLISQQRNVKATTATIKDVRSNQVLIVKIVGEDNSEVTKKVIN